MTYLLRFVARSLLLLLQLWVIHHPMVSQTGTRARYTPGQSIRLQVTDVQSATSPPHSLWYISACPWVRVLQDHGPSPKLCVKNAWTFISSACCSANLHPRGAAAPEPASAQRHQRMPCGRPVSVHGRFVVLPQNTTRLHLSGRRFLQSKLRTVPVAEMSMTWVTWLRSRRVLFLTRTNKRPRPCFSPAPSPSPRCSVLKVTPLTLRRSNHVSLLCRRLLSLHRLSKHNQRFWQTAWCINKATQVNLHYQGGIMRKVKKVKDWREDLNMFPPSGTAGRMSKMSRGRT